MSIHFDEQSRIFWLNTPRSSYAIGILEQENLLAHLYYGAGIAPDDVQFLSRVGDSLLSPARRAEQKLDRCFEEYYGLHHDVGFMWLPSAVADYRLTRDRDARRRGLHAANLLAGRFNPAGSYLRAWNDAETPADTAGWVIIDSMLNIPLLYWAWEETRDPRFRHMAIAHANTVMANFVRPDGSVRHVVEFDPETGRYRTDRGGQGCGQGSSWSRGQAWGMYGFAISYRHTGDTAYLDTAKRIAHYFIANIPEDGILPVDFRQPETPFWCDDTAAVIAACALIEISRAVGPQEQQMYLAPALRLLRALVEQHCDFTHQSDCILEKGTGAYHDANHEFPVIYGDYYLCEALFKLKGKDTLQPALAYVSLHYTEQIRIAELANAQATVEFAQQS